MSVKPSWSPGILGSTSKNNCVDLLCCCSLRLSVQSLCVLNTPFTWPKLTAQTSPADWISEEETDGASVLFPFLACL